MEPWNKGKIHMTEDEMQDCWELRFRIFLCVEHSYILWWLGVGRSVFVVTTTAVFFVVAWEILGI